MNNLPLLPLLQIFSEIDQDDLILNVRLVCKKWYFIINDLRFNELVLRQMVIDQKVEKAYNKLNNKNEKNLRLNKKITNCWFNPFEKSNTPFEPINPRSIICIRKLSNKFTDSNVFSHLFSNLKRFKSNLNSDFNLATLNCLTSLKHLEIESTIELKANVELFLPNLVFIMVFLKKVPFFKLKIHSNCLTDLCVLEDADNITLSNPISLKYIFSISATDKQIFCFVQYMNLKLRMFFYYSNDFPFLFQKKTLTSINNSNLQDMSFIRTKYKIHNCNDLISLINKAPILSQLHLYKPSLNNEFYDKLPNYAKLLEELKLEEIDGVKIKSFKFLNKFKILKKFETNIEIDIPSIIELLARIKLLSFFRCGSCLGALVVKIVRYKTEAYYAELGKYGWANMELDELLNEFRSIYECNKINKYLL